MTTTPRPEGGCRTAIVDMTGGKKLADGLLRPHHRNALMVVALAEMQRWG